MWPGSQDKKIRFVKPFLKKIFRDKNTNSNRISKIGGNAKENEKIQQLLDF